MVGLPSVHGDVHPCDDVVRFDGLGSGEGFDQAVIITALLAPVSDDAFARGIVLVAIRSENFVPELEQDFAGVFARLFRRRYTVRYICYMGMGMGGIAVGMRSHTPTFFVFSTLLVPTCVCVFSITRTFLVNKCTLFTQFAVVDAAVFRGPELVQSDPNCLPFAQTQAAYAGEFLVIVVEAGIGRAPRCHEQEHVRAVLFAGEVLRIAQIVVDEQGKDGGCSHISNHTLPCGSRSASTAPGFPRLHQSQPGAAQRPRKAAASSCRWRRW